MPTVDLDAARAARAEAKREPKIIVLGGEEFELVQEIYIDSFDKFMAGDAAGFFIDLMGEEQWERFSAHRPTDADLREMFLGVQPLYGLTVGESSASNGSSVNGGTRSRPTSRGTTRSTSGKRAGGPKRGARAGS